MMGKRLLDITLAGLGLLLLAPLLLLIALAIKLDSDGPVFFLQERVGRRGVAFKIYKFRTMRHNPAGGGALITVGNDSRITRVGALLRNTKLDELAQLFNVLGGSMSLVGPRPEVARYVAHYPAELRDKVLSVRPGITDYASLEFRNENNLLSMAANPEREYIDAVLPAKLRLQARYVDESSVATDLHILWRTVTTLLSR
jgi:lipopolysaccharide/colanic/teichoic acid biosynthesis glycosyltransferase